MIREAVVGGVGCARERGDSDGRCQGAVGKGGGKAVDGLLGRRQ